MPPPPTCHTTAPSPYPSPSSEVRAAGTKPSQVSPSHLRGPRWPGRQGGARPPRCPGLVILALPVPGRALVTAEASQEGSPPGAPREAGEVGPWRSSPKAPSLLDQPADRLGFPCDCPGPARPLGDRKKVRLDCERCVFPAITHARELVQSRPPTRKTLKADSRGRMPRKTLLDFALLQRTIQKQEENVTT